MKKMEYGNDFVGFLAYCFNKKETMQYIDDLEELIDTRDLEIKKLYEEIEILKIKLKDKNKIIKTLKEAK